MRKQVLSKVIDLIHLMKISGMLAFLETIVYLLTLYTVQVHLNGYERRLTYCGKERRNFSINPKIYTNLDINLIKNAC